MRTRSMASCGLLLALGAFSGTALRAETLAPVENARPATVTERSRPPSPVLLSVEIVADPPNAVVAHPDAASVEAGADPDDAVRPGPH